MGILGWLYFRDRGEGGLCSKFDTSPGDVALRPQEDQVVI